MFKHWMMALYAANNDGGAGGGGGSMDGFAGLAQQTAGGDDGVPADDWGDDFGDPFGDDGLEEAQDEGLADDVVQTLGKLTAEDTDDGTNPSGILDAASMRNAASQLIDTIKTDINRARLSDDLFGEEFQSGNPAAIRAAIEGAFRQARQSALADGIQPMSLVSNNLYNLLRGEMQQSISASRQAERDAGTLEALVPALRTTDPMGGTILKMVRAKAMQMGLKVQEQADLLNMYVKKYNIKAPAAQAANRRGPKRKVVSRGNQALDDIFGAFTQE